MEKLVPLVRGEPADCEVITLGLAGLPGLAATTLRSTIRWFRDKGAHFTTMTQAASEHYEHHGVGA